MNGVLGRMTNPYSAAESWIYDFFIAPAVASFHDGFGADLLSMVPEGGHVPTSAAAADISSFRSLSAAPTCT